MLLVIVAKFSTWIVEQFPTNAFIAIAHRFVISSYFSFTLDTAHVCQTVGT